MTTEFTRENRIKKLDLKIKYLAVHLTAMLIILTIFSFVVGSTAYDTSQKILVSSVLGIATVLIVISLKRAYSEVEDIFKD